VSAKSIKYKTRETWNYPGHSHQLTFSTFHCEPYFNSDAICTLLATRINKAAESHNFAVLAYVFMPDHVHLLIHPLDEIYNMSKILKSIKQGPSRSAKNRGLIEAGLWEEGPGHDSNISWEKARQDSIASIHNNPVRKGIVELGSQFRWSSANWYHHQGECDIHCRYFAFLWEGEVIE
jgi:putative transposase